MFGSGDLNGMFGGFALVLIAIGAVIGLAVAGAIWGIAKLLPHIIVIWK